MPRTGALVSTWVRCCYGALHAGKACEMDGIPSLKETPCSGRGRFIAGWCHCDPGYWGVECTRSKAWEPDPSEPLEAQGLAFARTSVRVYVYEFPWQIVHQTSAISYRYGAYPALYGIEEQFQRSLVTDHKVIAAQWQVLVCPHTLRTRAHAVRHLFAQVLTENPYEANLFYVPVTNIEFGVLVLAQSTPKARLKKPIVTAPQQAPATAPQQAMLLNTTPSPVLCRTLG